MRWDLSSSRNRWINKKTKAGTDGKIETKWNAATGQGNIFETVDTAVKHLPLLLTIVNKCIKPGCENGLSDCNKSTKLDRAIFLRELMEVKRTFLLHCNSKCNTSFQKGHQQNKQKQCGAILEKIDTLFNVCIHDKAKL